MCSLIQRSIKWIVRLQKAKIAESEESEDEMARNKKAARKKSLMKDSDLLKST